MWRPFLCAAEITSRRTTGRRRGGRAAARQRRRGGGGRVAPARRQRQSGGATARAGCWCEGAVDVVVRRGRGGFQAATAAGGVMWKPAPAALDVRRPQPQWRRRHRCRAAAAAEQVGGVAAGRRQSSDGKAEAARRPGGGAGELVALACCWCLRCRRLGEDLGGGGGGAGFAKDGPAAAPAMLRTPWRRRRRDGGYSAAAAHRVGGATAVRWRGGGGKGVAAGCLRQDSSGMEATPRRRGTVGARGLLAWSLAAGGGSSGGDGSGAGGVQSLPAGAPHVRRPVAHRWRRKRFRAAAFSKQVGNATVVPRIGVGGKTETPRRLCGVAVFFCARGMLVRSLTRGAGFLGRGGGGAGSLKARSATVRDMLRAPLRWRRRMRCRAAAAVQEAGNAAAVLRRGSGGAMAAAVWRRLDGSAKDAARLCWGAVGARGLLAWSLAGGGRSSGGDGGGAGGVKARRWWGEILGGYIRTEYSYPLWIWAEAGSS